jgi:hypothetical protein
MERPAARTFGLLQATEQIRSIWVNVKERVTSDFKEHLTAEQFRAAWERVKDDVRRSSGDTAGNSRVDQAAP